MDEQKDIFHAKAVQSILFKGRSDWYFCFLKSERIAHVLVLLATQAPGTAAEDLLETAHLAARVPQDILQFVAGETTPELVLADLFSLLSDIRLRATAAHVTQENATLLILECQALIERFAGSMPRSPFMVSDDFAVPSNILEVEPLPRSTFSDTHTAQARSLPIKDNKGQIEHQSKGHTERNKKVLDFVLQNKGVSIKDISNAVTDCSEKTIQRELALLVQQGLIKRVGERRWNIYLPA